MIGYDSITPQAPLVPAAVPPGNPARRFQHDVRNLFVDNGFTEVYNYTFLSEESVRAFGFDPAAHIRVTNPIASNQELMRASPAAGHLEERHRQRQAPRELPPVRNRPGDPPAGAGTAGRDSAPGRGALRSAGRRHLRTEAGRRVPAARGADRPGRSARLRASRARGRDPVEGRGGRDACSNCTRGSSRPGARRSSIWICGWWNRSAAGGRSTRPSGAIRRARSISR